MGKCTAPNCSYGYATYHGKKRGVFRCPKSDLEAWKKAIPRVWQQEPKTLYVCEIHFHAADIKHFGLCLDDGKQVPYRLPYPTLVEDALPSIFPGLPDYHQLPPPATTGLTRAEKELNLRKQLYQDQVARDQPVFSFEVFQREVSDKFASCRPSLDWHVILSDGCVCLVKVTHKPGIAVERSIEFHGSMEPGVWIDGLQQADLETVTSWIQLEELLATVSRKSSDTLEPVPVEAVKQPTSRKRKR